MENNSLSDGGPWIIAYVDVEIKETEMLRDNVSKTWKEAVYYFFEHFCYGRVDYIEKWLESCNSIQDLYNTCYVYTGGFIMIQRQNKIETRLD